jgi:hypothetical protein
VERGEIIWIGTGANSTLDSVIVELLKKLLEYRSAIQQRTDLEERSESTYMLANASAHASAHTWGVLEETGRRIRQRREAKYSSRY